MKYIIALFAIVSFASCKKEYTCSCTSPAGFSQTHVFKLSKKDKDDATKQCDALTISYQSRQDNTTCQLQ